MLSINLASSYLRSEFWLDVTWRRLENTMKESCVLKDLNRLPKYELQVLNKPLFPKEKSYNLEVVLSRTQHKVFKWNHHYSIDDNLDQKINSELFYSAILTKNGGASYELDHVHVNHFAFFPFWFIGRHLLFQWNRYESYFHWNALRLSR